MSDNPVLEEWVVGVRAIKVAEDTYEYEAYIRNDALRVEARARSETRDGALNRLARVCNPEMAVWIARTV